uniref:Uncharacterized protein n=1 Tax=Aegilops tauschii subsp. strangulata TaxID=200361 RepID=A0A453CFQ2_AEGTS
CRQEEGVSNSVRRVHREDVQCALVLPPSSRSPDCGSHPCMQFSFPNGFCSRSCHPHTELYSFVGRSCERL